MLPVLEDGVCRGLVSVMKMTRFFFPTPSRLFDSRRVLASIDNLAATARRAGGFLRQSLR